MITSLLALVVLGQSVLDGDPKLETKITMECPAQTVEDVLASVSEKVGERIYAAPAIRNDVLVLLVTERPAKECLQVISNHFSWSWERTSEGLKLTRTAKQEIDEEKAARDAQLLTYRNWRQKSIEALGVKNEGGDKAEYQQLLEENKDLLERYDAEYYGEDKKIRDKWIADRRRNEARRAELARRLSPQWRLFDQIVANLSDDDMLALDGARKVVISSRPTAWQKATPGSLSALVHDVIENVAQSSAQLDNPDRNERERDFLLSAYQNFKPANVGALRLVLKQDFNVEPTFPRQYPMGQLALLGTDGALLGQSYVSARYADDRQTPQLPKVEEDPALNVPLEETEWVRSAKAAEKDPAFWAEINAKSLAEFIKPGSKAHPAKGAASVMIEVAKAANVNLVSDVYDRPNWNRAAPIPLGTKSLAFRQLAASISSTWQCESGWLRFRSRYWQFARRNSIPCDSLRGMRDVLVKDNFSLDALAACTLKVTNRQFWSPFLGVLIGLTDWAVVDRSERPFYLLRFWGSTPESMKRNLLKGEMVRFGDLSREQQRNLSEFVFRQDEQRYDSRIGIGSSYGLDEEDVAWVKKNWPRLEESYAMADDEPSQILPSGIPASALVGVHESTGNALVVSRDGWSMKMSEQMAIISGYYSPDGRFQAIPTTESRMFFTVLPSPGWGYGLQMGAIRTPKDVKPMPYNDFPAEIKTRLDKALELRKSGGVE